MERRNFLKGLLGIAGVVALAKIPASEAAHACMKGVLYHVDSGNHHFEGITRSTEFNKHPYLNVGDKIQFDGRGEYAMVLEASPMAFTVSKLPVDCSMYSMAREVKQ